MNVDPDRLPLRAAERLGRLFTWAMQLDLSRQERAVLMHLIEAGNEHLDSTWSHASIAAKIDYSERVVRDGLKSLAKQRVISRAARKHADGTRNSDRIRVLPPAELLRPRSSYAELRAEIDGELAAEAYAAGWADYGLSIGPANAAAPLNSGAALSAEEPSYTSIEERDLKVQRQMLPVGFRKPRCDRATQPRKIAAALKVLSDVERTKAAA